MNKIKCSDVRKIILLYLDGNFQNNPLLENDIKKHLATCKKCKNLRYIALFTEKALTKLGEDERCLEPYEIDDFLDKKLDKERMRKLSLHIKSCLFCSQFIEEYEEERDSIKKSSYKTSYYFNKEDDNIFQMAASPYEDNNDIIYPEYFSDAKNEWSLILNVNEAQYIYTSFERFPNSLRGTQVILEIPQLNISSPIIVKNNDEVILEKSNLLKEKRVNLSDIERIILKREDEYNIELLKNR